MPKLLLIVSAPVIPLPDGQFRLDIKFVEGMRLFQDLWDGTIQVLLWKGNTTIPFGAEYHPSALGFTMTVMEPGAPITADKVQGQDIVAAAADLHKVLHLPTFCGGAGQPKLVYSIEYAIGTRLRIVSLDQSRTLPRKAWSALWTLRHELRRRAAFRRANGVQANGFPAYDAYNRLNRNMITYLDNRMRPEMMATPAEMAARADYLQGDGPLRLINSGRLEPMKGAQDLVPLARQLSDAGVDFTLDIYGTGSLEDKIRSDATTFGLSDRVRLHAPVDFETELVPLMRTSADLFLCCHRQADPSCTYLESMGCGLPILGYRNKMWAAMHTDCGAGWSVRLGDVSGLAAQITALAAGRSALVDHGARAVAYTTRHDFRTEFAKRIDHWAATARS